jgi:predicted dithiol-disulfide oxidoreductase (DUF899 family)
MPHPMSEPTRNGYSSLDAMAAPIGAPLPGCRSGIAATWTMPSSAATWWHWSRAADSIQLVGDANTATVAGTEPCRGGGADKALSSLKWGADGRRAARAAVGGGSVRQSVMATTVPEPPPGDNRISVDVAARPAGCRCAGTRAGHRRRNVGPMTAPSHTTTPPLPPVVSEQDWQAARDALLVREKELTRALDDLAAARRRLPMARFRTDYAFTGPTGPAGLLDLFEGRRQLIVYQFMDNGPDDYCSGCSSMTDNVADLSHLHARDVTYAVVSNMPYEQLTAFWKRMGWTVPVYSSRGTTFTDDCGTGGGFGLSVFLRDGSDVYRTYFTTSRGVDRLRVDFNLLDLVPYGRQESWEDSPDGWPQSAPYAWWRLHDEY